MSNHVIAGLGLVLVATNLWWWWRTRAIRRSLTVSRQRDDRVADRLEEQTTAGTETAALLSEAAARADCPPAELPTRIGELRDRIGTLESELAEAREAWADAWWCRRDGPSESPVVTVTLDRGDHDDVTALATAQARASRSIVLAVGGADGSVAVGVGEGLRDLAAADEILADVLDRTDGKGGGGPALATGGGASVSAAESAVATVARQLRDRLD